MTDHNILVLFGLVDGEDNFFQVKPNSGDSVMDLKEQIVKVKAAALQGVDANQIVLKLVSEVPINAAQRLRERIDELEKSGATIELGDALASLQEIFPVQPPKKNLHFIVKHPFLGRQGSAQLRRTLTPTPHRELWLQIKAELSSLRETVKAFIKNPEPLSWIPPEHATPAHREFLSKLKIPTYPNGDPSLLLHNLRVCDDHEIEKMFRSGRHLFICNTSGSGKSRRILESLTKYWGFYFVALPDPNGVGVDDLYFAINQVLLFPRWQPDLTSLPSKTDQHEENIRIATRCLQEAVAARVVVFELFLELAIEIDGSLQEKHKYIWLLFQLFNPPGLSLHPFRRIMENCMVLATKDALGKIIQRLHAIRQQHFPSLRFVIGLDEAQWAARCYPRAFLSLSDDNVYRSILREIARLFIDMNVRLVVSGTVLSLEEVEDAVASGVSKPETVTLVHELGMFDTWSRLRPFLECYIPASFLDSTSGHRLTTRIREYLLGRYRFSVSFIECLLRNGLESPHKLLTEYISVYTSCLPGDIGAPFALQEPDLHIQIKIKTFEWDRLKKDSAALRSATDIVQSHVTRGAAPTYGAHFKLVEYGIARFRTKHEGCIAEPLAFLSLMKWLEGQDDLNVQAGLRT